MKHARGLARAILAIVALPFLVGCSLDLSLVEPAPPVSGTETPPGPPPGAELLAPDVWRCPQNLAGTTFIGEVAGTTYYWPDCGQAENIEQKDRICFATADAARAYGFKPCHNCP